MSDEKKSMLDRFRPRMSPLEAALAKLEALVNTENQDNKKPRYDAKGRER